MIWALALWLTPPALVVDVLPSHEQHRFSWSVLGTALASYDGRDADAVLGGGLALSWLNGRNWPSEWWWFALDVRASVTARNEGAHYDTELPVDVFVKGGVNLVARGDASAWSGYPADIRAALPLEPYVGLGGTVAVKLSSGDVRAGPLALVGLQWWFGDRFAVFAELVAGVLFGGSNALLRTGGNVGASFTL